ncbi:hypothetical protein C1645_763841 [Glomus cerebriforme]|uniref:3CxxC-type domain-containing protein n=1 Tax=Glomus cerebriforme TaxID=658196 RepID=A0A397T6F9_9GLOM|nr:hypothetical protein C1645_763841 [Glomus cerebriforme]
MGQSISATTETISAEETSFWEETYSRRNIEQTVSTTNSQRITPEENNDNIAEISTSREGEYSISPYSPYNTSLRKKNTNSYESQFSHFMKEKYTTEIVTEIIRYLTTKGDNYEVYGYWYCRQWRCKHSPKCENKSQCEYKNECHERQFPFTRELLEEYLTNPEKLHNSFKRRCIECNKTNMISSFRLYTPSQENSIVKELTVEIICHLEWNKHYRVFGSWKCSHCRKKWKSAYTWISLQKFIEQIPGMHLNQDNYFMQECKRCEKCDECDNDKNIILSYEPLVQSKDNKEHVMESCAKCKYYNVRCVELDSYFGDDDDSNILLM